MSGSVFPPIVDRSSLPGRVLVVVAHPDDEIIGIGGLLGFHAERGDHVEVWHATGGGAGDPDARFGDIVELRSREADAALAVCGVGKARKLGHTDGALDESEGELQAQLARVFAEVGPSLLYTFHGGEYHGDHRALARAACAARDALPDACRVLLFGVNQSPAFASLFDYSDRVDRKRDALACFASQLAYIDFSRKVFCHDEGATVNVELEAVTHAELCVEVAIDAWPAHLERCASELFAAEDARVGES